MYNRDYLTNKTSEEINSKVSINEFLSQTYKLIAGSILACLVGLYLTLPYASVFSMPLMIGILVVEIGLIFAINIMKHKLGVNLGLLFLFGFVTGVSIVPLMSVALGMPNGASIVGQAALMTMLITGGMSMFALTTKKDFSFMGPFLITAVIGMIVIGLLNVFFFQNSMLHFVMSIIGALIFSAYILYDTQNIVKGLYQTPIEAALSMYINIFMLFQNLLSILIHTNSDD